MLRVLFVAWHCGVEYGMGFMIMGWWRRIVATFVGFILWGFVPILWGGYSLVPCPVYCGIGVHVVSTWCQHGVYAASMCAAGPHMRAQVSLLRSVHVVFVGSRGSTVVVADGCLWRSACTAGELPEPVARASSIFVIAAVQRACEHAMHAQVPFPSPSFSFHNNVGAP